MNSDLTSQEAEALRASHIQAESAIASEAVSPISLVAPERSLKRFENALQNRLVYFYDRLRQMQRHIFHQNLPINILPLALTPSEQIENQSNQWPTTWALNTGTENPETLCYMTIDNVLSFSLVELAYGASFDQIRKSEALENKSLTSLEKSILHPYLRHAAEELLKTFAEQRPIPPHWSWSDIRLPLTMPRGSDAAWRQSYEIVLGEKRKAYFTLILLPAGIAEILGSARSGSQQEIAQILLKNCLEVQSMVSAELGRVSVAINHLADLKVGELLWLETSQYDDIPILVENVASFTARPVQRRGALGLKIIQRINKK